MYTNESRVRTTFSNFVHSSLPMFRAFLPNVTALKGIYELGKNTICEPSEPFGQAVITISRRQCVAMGNRPAKSLVDYSHLIDGDTGVDPLQSSVSCSGTMRICLFGHAGVGVSSDVRTARDLPESSISPRGGH